VKLAEKGSAPRKFTVNLYFLEPDQVSPGERLFTVRVQEKPIIESLDVVQEAGGQNRTLVKSLPGVEVADELILELQPLAGAKVQNTLLSGVELIAERR
jgi:hypothetical protein